MESPGWFRASDARELMSRLMQSYATSRTRRATAPIRLTKEARTFPKLVAEVPSRLNVPVAPWSWE